MPRVYLFARAINWLRFTMNSTPLAGTGVEYTELRGVEIDGVYYATVKRKRNTLLHLGDCIVTLVGVLVSDPD